MSSEQAQKLTTQLLDSKFVLNVDGLLDGIIALWNDCNNPVLKKTHRNIESFLERNENVVKTLLECRISTNNFNLIKVIGRGAFGEVQLVRNAQNKKVYAMKLLEKEKMSKRTDAAFFWEERDIMAYANSEWIVRLHYAFQDQRYLYMVMEFMPGGDLVNLMANHDIPEDWVQFYTAELVLALTTIHTMGYIHRDVKPDNMLISASGHIKLADFGTCVKMNPDGLVRCSTAVGTPDYISPEVLRHQGSEGTFGREVDWWAVGVTMYEMLVGETPFYSDSLITTYQRIQEHNKHLKFPDDVKMSNQAKDIVRKFLAEPNVRLGKDSVAAIKAHPFFKNAQWNFDTIKNGISATPPYIPQLVSDDDASHFDEVEPAQAINLDNFHQGPKGFSGNELPFIGFTYSNEFGPLEIIRQQIIIKNSEAQKQQIDTTTNEQKSTTTTVTTTANGQNQQQNEQNGAGANQQSQQQLLTNGELNNVTTIPEMAPPPHQQHQQHHPAMEENNIVEHHRQPQQKMVAPPRHSAEVETLKFEKRVIENKMKDLQEQVNLFRKQSEDYQQRLEAEQKFIELYKLEIEAREKDNVERDKRLQSIPALEQQIEEFRQKFERERDDAERDKRLQTIPALEQQIEEFRQTLERERGSRGLLESSFLNLQREKSLLETEMRQMMQRHEQEYKTYDAKLQTAAQRENDLTNRVHQLENEVSHIRKHSHGPMGLAPVSGATSGLSSAISTSSLVSNANSLSSAGLHNVTLSSAAGGGGDLEGLTKEQLIQRCQREIQMKQQVIDKLAYLGMQKGINDDLADRGVNSKKKKKRDEKRIREVVEFQMDQQSKKYVQKIQQLEESIQYLHLLLHEEQQKVEAKDELLAKYKQQKGELTDATRNLMPLEPRRVPPRRLRGAV